MTARSAFAYVPGRSPLHRASATAAIVYLGSLAVVALTFSNPIVLAGAGLAVAIAGLAAGAGRAIAAAGRAGLTLGVLIVAVNAVVAQRGETVLLRGGELPVLGPLDVTFEALTEGGVLGLRILVVLAVFAVYSACVDPDAVLRLVRGVARRSALTATLLARMVPLAAADHARLREAAALRGPGAAPAGHAALLRRLVAGSLDRAVDAAATLELRGYAVAVPGRPAPRRRSRHDRRLLVCGLAILTASVAARVAGTAAFDAYPELSLATGPGTLALAAALPPVAAIPFLDSHLVPGLRRPRALPDGLTDA